MLSPEEAEIKLLSTIQTPTDLTTCSGEGITESSFIIYGDVYTYIESYIKDYAAVPSKEDLESVFNHLDLKLHDPGKLEYYIREVQNHDTVRRTHSAVVERFGENGKTLQQSPMETVRLLMEDLRKIQPTSLTHVAWLDKDALERLKWLKEKADANAEGKVLGIPTGIRCFDDVMQGWQPGEAIMVMAPKGVGKSWMAMYFATIAYREGCKVLFFTPEMSWQECALRFDVLLAYQVGQRLSHTGLATGQSDQDLYEVWLKELTRREQFIVIDSPGVGGFTTANVLTAIDQYRPDLVVLDGLHLVTGEPGQTGWEVMKTTADALKALAQHLNHTVIWTSQVDREAMRNATEPASTGASAAYGKAAVEAANRLITLGSHEHDPRMRTFKIPNNRSGREWHTRQYLMFDVDNGSIYQTDYQLTTDGDEPF